MSRIIKGASAHVDTVVVGQQPVVPFVAASFGNPSGGRPGPDGSEPGQKGPLEAARAQAERIVAEAKAQADAIVREAMSQGYAEGRALGLKEAEEQIRDHLRRIAELASRATIDADAMVRSADNELASLALAIAAKIVRREVSVDPTVVLSIAQGALEHTVPSGSVRILVHPDDVELLRSRWTDLRSSAVFGTEWEVVGDDRMERGGCVVETRGGVVDARIESQLDRIAAAFEVGSCAQ